MNEGRSIEHLKYEFTDKEKSDLKDELAAKVLQIVAWEDEKTMVTTDLNGRIKNGNKDAVTLARKIQAGFEIREIDCIILWDTPVAGMKRYVALDTTEIVRDEEMTVDERRQQRLDFESTEGNSNVN